MRSAANRSEEVECHPSGMSWREIANSRFQPVSVWKRAEACCQELRFDVGESLDIWL
jgi:hypothetical protein